MPSIWTPLPPSRSGIAHYAWTLFGTAPEFAAYDFVVEDEAQARRPRARRASARDYEDRRAFLQLGNNVHHAFCCARAQREGAVIELHDLSLHHLHTEMTLARGDFPSYLRGLEACEGEWGRRFAFQRSKGFYTPSLEFQTRVNRVVCERAAAVIVHSRWAKLQLELQGVSTPIHVVEHFAVPVEETPAKVRTKAEARLGLGLPRDAFLIVHQGHVTRPKRVEWTLEAFERLVAAGRDAMLVFAGSCANARLAERIEASPARRRIRLCGYVPDGDFEHYTLAADILPLVRFPSAGESSGVASRALGFGRLAVLPELMAFGDVDDAVCEKVHLDADPVDQLEAIFLRYADDPAALAAKEEAARAHAAARLHPSVLRREIAAILDWTWGGAATATATAAAAVPTTDAEIDPWRRASSG